MIYPPWFSNGSPAEFSTSQRNISAEGEDVVESLAANYFLREAEMGSQEKWFEWGKILWNINPIGSMYGIFTYIGIILNYY